jgi:tetratricopeptide (TPR) repeat protein
VIAVSFFTQYFLGANCLGADQFQTAVTLYSKGDYQSALPLLEGLAHGSKKSDPTAHYYLANTYLKLGQRESALREYGASYRLDPNGSCSSFCKQAISSLSSETGGTVTGGWQGGGASGSMTPARARSASYVPTTSNTSAVTDIDIRRQLPSVPTREQLLSRYEHNPVHSTKLRYNDLYDKRVRQVRTDIIRLQQELDKARQKQKDAWSISMQLVPNSPAYNESPSQFHYRVENGTRTQKELMSRYDDYVAACEETLKERRDLLQQLMDHPYSDY